MSDQRSSSGAVIAGGLAGLVSRFFTAPLDLLKIRLQLQHGNFAGDAASKGAWQLGREIYSQEGIMGFWKGNLPAEYLYVAYNATQFYAYQQIMNSMKTHNVQLSSHAMASVSGAFGAIFGTVSTYPLDLLRTRFAAQSQTRIYTSLMHSIQEIYTAEGVRGFYHGLSSAIIQTAPYMALIFGSNDAFKKLLDKLNLQSGVRDATAGLMAGVVSKIATFPLDTIRKRMQVRGSAKSLYQGPVYDSGLVGLFQGILRNEGIRGLYRGCLIATTKAAPSAAITLWTYEESMKLIGKLKSS